MEATYLVSMSRTKNVSYLMSKALAIYVALLTKECYYSEGHYIGRQKINNQASL